MRNAHTWLAVAAMAVVGMAAGGCAISRSEVRLAAPAAETAAAPTGRTVVIRSVRDERVFEQSPRDPSTPSLGGEGAGAASADVKSRAIARKRNAYGGAMGDVLLQPGRTVESVVRENLGAALRKNGFDVREAAAAGASPIVIDVHIRKFWAWFTPGFWAITLRANIRTELAISGSSPALDISVQAEQSGMVAGDDAWIEVIEKALRLYRDQVAEKTTALK